MALMRGSLYLFWHLTSILSPKVHTMTAPVPKEESTSGSSSIGTTWLNSGTVAFFPTIGLNVGSSGWTSMATQAGSSSGLVDATSSFRSSWPNSMSYSTLTLSWWFWTHLYKFCWREFVLSDLLRLLCPHLWREAVTVPALSEVYVESVHPAVSGGEIEV